MPIVNTLSNFQNNLNATLITNNEGGISDAATELRTSEHMSHGAKLFLNIITLGIAGHFIDKHEQAADAKILKQCAQDVIALKAKLDSLDDTIEQDFTVHMGDSDTEVHQDSDGSLICNIEGRSIGSAFKTKELAARIEDDMTSNIDFYGKNAVCDLLESKRDPTNDIGTAPSRDRQLCLQVMHSVAGMEEQEFANTPTSLLHTFALNALNAKEFNPDTLRAFQADMANAHHIASEDAQGLLDELSDAMRADSASVENKVNLDALRGPVNEPIAGAGQGHEHVTTWHEVHNLAADLVSNEDSQVYDANIETPGKRIKETFSEHIETLADIIQHRELLNTLPPEIRVPVSDAIGEFEAALHDMTGQNLGMVNTELLRTAVSLVPDASFADCESKLDGFVQEAASQIQTKVDAQFAQIFTPEGAPAGVDGAHADDAPDPVQSFEEGMYTPPSRADKSSVNIDYENKILDGMLKENSGANSGQGQFMSAVFSKYFSNMASIDQRNMIAASIRYATTQDSEGAQLGALLKGAGPIMQKMLQGFNTTDMAPEMKTALGDMKDSLASIHPKVITAHLLDMVEKSHGEITNITVNRSLGAASVGQAFLCTMTKQDGSQQECVVKILRPDVQNRAFREQALFVEASKQVPGMEVTFAGQLSRIMEELDLRLEAKNVVDGAVYDGSLGCEALESMKLNPLVEPTANTMVIDKAPGTTLAGYIRDTSAQITTIIESANQGDPVEDILDRNKQLEDLYADVKQRQLHLSSLSAAWVEEGIFGKGFYHGDLHAGNIMTDAEKMTVIDFGNATSLTKDQQGSVTRMMCGASVGDSKIFLKSYQELLSPNGQELFSANKAQIAETVDKIMSLGGPSQTGQRIGVILTKLQNLGLELPAPIYNFSQCQLRLQGALDGMNSLMSNIEAALTHTGSTLENAKPHYSLNHGVIATIAKNYSQETKQKAIDEARAALPSQTPFIFDLIKNALPLYDVRPNIIDTVSPPARFPELKPFFDDCVEKRNAPDFEDAIQRFTDKFHELSAAELDTMEASIPNMTQKRPPRDFCSCMSDVISNHLHTIISQLGLRDSIRMQWMRV